MLTNRIIPALRRTLGLALSAIDTDNGGIRHTAPTAPGTDSAASLWYYGPTRMTDTRTAAQFQTLATRLLRQARVLDDGTLTSAQYAAMASLYAQPRLALTELAALEGVTHPTMSRLVTTLITQGLVARQADPADRRSTRLSLTDAGRAVYEQVYARRLKLIGTILDRLKPETVADLLAALSDLPALKS